MPSGGVPLVQRVVILGRGGAGKSTLAVRLGAITGIPVVELDAIFWRPGLSPTPPDEWTIAQQRFVDRPAWIADGDLGPYDVLTTRLAVADTVVVLDFALARCAWRALRRGRENADFWRWLLTYRRRSLPNILAVIRRTAPHATVHILGSPRAVAHFFGDLCSSLTDDDED